MNNTLLPNDNERCFLRINNTIVAIVVAFLVSATFVPMLHAATYYVDQNHASAHDSNPGTESLPWKTIGYAADIAKAGDIVYVKQGIYYERVVPKNSGTSENKIIFKSLPRRASAIDGGFDINRAYIRIEGFKITSSVTGRSGVEVSGDYVEVVDNYIWNVRGRAIMGDQRGKPTGVYISDNHIYHCQMGICVYGHNWLVERNEVERLYMYGGVNDCDYARVFGDGNTFRGNYFHGSIMGEIGSAHVDCLQTWCGGSGSVFWATNTTVDGNTCYDFHQAMMIEEGSCGSTVSGFTVIRNIFAHTFDTGHGGYGINNQGVDYVAVIGNTFADIYYGGADMFMGDDPAKNAVIKNNVFYKCGRGYSFSDPSTSTGDYNLIFGSVDRSPSAAHNIIDSDPLFVDPYNNDYSLQQESPACGAGEGGTDIGAIPCNGSTTSVRPPSPPTNFHLADPFE